MLDRIMAVLALATLVAYLGIFIVNVPRPALIVVTAIVLAMAVYDFVRQLRRLSRRDR